MKFDRNAVNGWTGAVCAGAAALAAVFVGLGQRWHVAVLALLVVAAVALIILIFIGLQFDRITRLTRRTQPPTPEEIDRARINLHAALSGAWSEEGSEVYEDLPMRVRFAPWPGNAGQPALAEAVHDGGPEEEQSQTGDFDTVAEVFSRVPRYRRVILGEAGAGKTVLVTELQRKLVEAPQPGDPLPVIVPAAAWRPDEQSLLEWLAKQLAADYGWLPVEHARALVARGFVLPILDGLDEMPSFLRGDAIARINKYHVYRPLIITSREGEYRNAIRESRMGVKGSVVVAVQPLHLDDTKDYLDAVGGDWWAKLLADMKANPAGPLARVLTNPLMLWMARVEYEDKNPDHLALFGSRRSLENYLLAEFVPSVYSGDSSRAAARQSRGTAPQAERWLGNLAEEIYQQYRSNQRAQQDEQEAEEDGRRADVGGAPLLAWWEIGYLAGRWRRLGVAVRAAALCSVAVALGLWVLKRQGNWRHGSYSGPVNYRDLFLSGPVGRLIWPTLQVLSRAANNLGKNHGGFTRFLHSASGVVSAILTHPLLVVLVLVLFVGTVAARRPLGAYYPLRVRIRIRALLRRLVPCFVLLVLAAIGAYFLMRGAHWPVNASVFFSSRSTWITLSAFSLLGLIRGSRTFITRSDAYGNLSPEESLRLDRHADAVSTISGRFTFAVAVWLICGSQVTIAYTWYAIAATVLAYALGGQRSFASRSYVDARNWLAGQGQIPWRTMAFLADASRRGVLRPVGAAYQFRHVRLLEQVGYWRRADGGGWLERGMDDLAELGHAARDFAAGWPDVALDRIRVKAERYQRAAGADPAELASLLVQSLDRLAEQLRRWPGQRAQDALRNVLGTYRMLARADPEAFSPRLADVLKESAGAFEPGEAAGISGEAVDRYRELAQTDLTYLPALGEAAGDLAGWLESRPDSQGQDVVRDALDAYRTLAGADPAAHGAGLARALKVSARAFAWDEALGVSREAVACYRELTQTDPTALAQAASDLAVRLYRLGRLAEALNLTSDIVGAARDRAEGDSEVCWPVLARSLVDQGRWLWEFKSLRGESVRVWTRAAAIYGDLANEDPARFGLMLTSTLDLLMSALLMLQREDDELAVIRWALDAYRERAERIVVTRRQLAEPELAALLQRRQQLGATKQAFGGAGARQRMRTLAAARTTAAMCGELAESSPAELLPDLADAVDGLAVELKASGRRREAWILADRADRIRSQYRRAPDVMRRQTREDRPLARMDVLALRLWKLGEGQEAVAAGHVSRDLAQEGTMGGTSATSVRARLTLLLLQLREELEMRPYENTVRFWRRSVSRLQERAKRDPDVGRSLAEASRNLVMALERQSDALDTLAFRRLVSDRSKSARTATRRAIKAKNEAAG